MDRNFFYFQMWAVEQKGLRIIGVAQEGEKERKIGEGSSVGWDGETDDK